MTLYRIRRIWHPAVYQGAGRTRNYFEGWYFKLVDRERTASLAVIPGISRRSTSDAHAFIQLIDGDSGETAYHRYPAGAFHFSKKRLDVTVGGSRFSDQGITLDIPDGHRRAAGSVDFHNPTPLEGGLFSPGIMGWYSFVPFMECYHGIVSLDHGLSGNLRLNGKTIDFDGGRGYIEKDWGRSMPSSWIWMQSNHFSAPGRSFSFSIARIPWLRGHFIGHIGILLRDGRQLRFATYTGSRVQSLEVRENGCRIELRDKQHGLIIKASRKRGGVLRAPVSGRMERRISESIDATVHVTLTDKSGNVLFDDSGARAGLEMVGDLDELKELN